MPTAIAGETQIRIQDSRGERIVNAVLFQDSDISPEAGDLTWAAAMAQQNRAFVPHVLVVPVGTRVQFPNRDRFRHHVYSFSSGNRFEIKLYGRDETRSVVFDSPGLVALGCNIHDEMSGYIHVVEAGVTAISDAEDDIRIAGLSADRPVRLWVPGQADRMLDVGPPPDNSVLVLTLAEDRQRATWSVPE